MNQPRDNLDFELWARGLRRRWWQTAFAPVGNLLRAGAHGLLHRLPVMTTLSRSDLQFILRNPRIRGGRL
jgi:hypothetical protein